MICLDNFIVTVAKHIKQIHGIVNAETQHWTIIGKH